MCHQTHRDTAAEHRADSLAVIVTGLLAIDIRRSADSAAAHDTTQRLRAAFRASGIRGARTQRVADSLRAVVDAVPDTMVSKRLAQQLADSLGGVIHATGAQRDTAEHLLAIAVRQRLASDSTARAWRVTATALQANLRAALKGRRWGCVAGVGATAGVSQYALGVGFTCGRKVA